MRNRRTLRSITAAILSVFLLTGSFSRPVLAAESRNMPRTVLAVGTTDTANADNSGSDKVMVEDLGELKAPTEFPVKGTLCAQIVRSKTTLPDGAASYNYEEEYLPVLVDANQKVYADLDIIVAKLKMRVVEYETSKKVIFNGTELYFNLNDPVVGYQMPMFTMMVNVGASPVLFEEKWYVPLDAFCYMTDTVAIYGKENWLGKKQLNLIPPQRTVLEDMGEFYGKVFDRYAFTYWKDVGYTEKQAEKVAGQTSIVRYIFGLGTLDLNMFGRMAWGNGEGPDAASFQDEYAQKFMDYMLQENENISAQLLQDLGKNLDYTGAALDICSDMNNGNTAAAIEQARKLLKLQGKGKYLEKILGKAELGSLLAMGGKYFVNFASVGDMLANVDDWSTDGVALFCENKPSGEKQALTDKQYKVIQNKLKEYDSFIADGWYDEFMKQNWQSLLLDVGSMLEYGAAKAAALESTVWEFSANFLVGDYLEATEDYLAGMFGIQYETDSVWSARAELDKYLYGNSPVSITEEQEQKLRRLFFHAAKACYVTRYFGCKGCQGLMKDNPGLWKKQESINEDLSVLAARFQNEAIPLGRLPGELAQAGYIQQEHYPNVLYNLCSLEGTITDWEDEKPAKNVKVEVLDELGEVLTEFETDEEGCFKKEFALAEMNVWKDRPAVQELTLRMNYKKNPVVMENIEVNYFHKYEVKNLHVGRKTEEGVAYVLGARQSGDKVLMDIWRVDFTEDAVFLDVPDFQGGSITAYTAMEGQMILAPEVITVELEEGMEFGTYFSQVMPEHSLLRGMVSYTNSIEEMNGIIPEALTKLSLKTAEDIQDYVDAYYQLGHEYPTFYIKTTNSLVLSVDVAVVVASGAKPGVEETE